MASNTAQKGTTKRPPRKPLELRKTQFRSALTTGKDVLADIDGRSAAARRYADLVAMHVADLGGADAISAAELSLVKRCALMTLELERLESKFAANDGASLKELETYSRVAGGLRRLLQSLGLRRRQRDITPSPLEYARQKAMEAA